MPPFEKYDGGRPAAEIASIRLLAGPQSRMGDLNQCYTANERPLHLNTMVDQLSWSHIYRAHVNDRLYDMVMSVGFPAFFCSAPTDISIFNIFIYNIMV